MTQASTESLPEKSGLPENRGRWVTAAVFAEHFGVSIYTLGNWRYQDRLEGRVEAEPGFPKYKRAGATVRYWMEF